MNTRPRSRPPKLAIEAVVIFGLIALTAGLIYHFVVHTIRNPRPLGGANVNVSRAQGDAERGVVRDRPVAAAHPLRSVERQQRRPGARLRLRRRRSHLAAQRGAGPARRIVRVRRAEGCDRQRRPPVPRLRLQDVLRRPAHAVPRVHVARRCARAVGAARSHRHPGRGDTALTTRPILRSTSGAAGCTSPGRAA